MKGYMIAGCIVAMILICGCTMPGQTEAATPTPEETALPVTTAAPTSAAPTEPPEPFPDALDYKGTYVYGDDEDKRSITVYYAFTEPSYWWSSADTGSNWETKPYYPEDDQFLFILLRVKHLGTKKEIGAPFPGNMDIWFNGQTYSYWSERDNDSPPVVDSRLPYDDYYGGILHIYEERDGFLIFEVPKTLTTDAAYLQIILGGDDGSPVWKLA